MNGLALAWRQARRDLRAGEVRILIAALVLAVVAVTAVGFITDRAERGLAIEANRLIGGDAVVRSDAPLPDAIVAASRAPGLRQAQTQDMQTMIRVGTGETARLQLGELRALGEGYPLRGVVRVVDETGAERDAERIPAAGTAWLSRAGADTLDARVGDTVLTQEPDAAMDYFNVAPKVHINLDDLPGTGLVQEGSRVGYRLAVAGHASAVDGFTRGVRPLLGRGQRMETIGDARPEMRSALDRAGRFLGLAALVSVVLAAVAVAMAARRHSERHRAGAAVMRCLGASQSTIATVHLGELAIIGLGASALGVALAFGLQELVAGWLARSLGISIPRAGLAPALEGLGVGLTVLLAFGAPPVLALRRVPALRVLRRDVDTAEPSAWAVGLLGTAGLAALLWWKAGSPALAGAMLGGIAATLAVLALLGWALIIAVRRLRSRLRGSLRYGLANVSRRAGASVAQIAALGLGLMVLLLLTFVRTDLIDRWQLSLSANAPNRFIVNVQDEQLEPMRAFMAARSLEAPTLYPMIRARLSAHNGREVDRSVYADSGARAQRLAEREFNLSVTSALSDDNRVTAGRFWGASGASGPELSVEERFAETLGWKLGDRVRFDIAGQDFEGTITSLRSVEWESFRPNFFVVASPGALDGYPASYITAVGVPPTDARFTAELVEQFPNLSVIDIDAVLAQVRSTGDQVAMIVQVVFWFALGSGLLVLMAAVSASQDERLLEGGVMRVLGASRRQLRLAQASEFFAIGLLSGLTAAIAASVLAGVVATRVFDLPWQADWRLAAGGAAAGVLAALGAGLLATRRVLDAPPSVTLRELQS